MKYISLIAVCMFVAACSTTPTDHSDDSGLHQSPTMNDLDPNEEPQTASKGTKPVAPPSEKSGEAPKRETPSKSYAALSEAYKSQNDEGIQKAANQILGQNPSDAKALNALGLFHYRKGRFLAARYFFNRASAASPTSGEPFSNLGLVSLALDEPREAIRYFRKALDLKGNDGIAAANLGAIYVHDKDYVKANIALEIAVNNGMREVRTLNNYGISLVGMGQFDQAKKRYEEAIKLASNNQEVLFNLAVLLIDKMKNPNEGLDQLNRLRFLGPAPETRNKMNALENRAKAGIK